MSTGGYSSPGRYRDSFDLDIEMEQTFRETIMEHLNEKLEDESKDTEVNPHGKKPLPVQEVEGLFIHLNKLPDMDSNVVEITVHYRYRQGLY